MYEISTSHNIVSRHIRVFFLKEIMDLYTAGRVVNTRFLLFAWTFDDK